jgi:hypothetical protein
MGSDLGQICLSYHRTRVNIVPLLTIRTHDLLNKSVYICILNEVISIMTNYSQHDIKHIIHYFLVKITAASSLHRFE